MRAFTFPMLGLLTAVTLGLSVVGCGTSETPTADDAAPDAAEVTMISFANESCPMMGGDPDPELTREWNGKTIGFCCDGCPEDWDALSEEEKAQKFAAASEADGHGDHEHGDHEHGDHEHGDHEHGDHEHGDHEHGAAGEAADGDA